MKKGIIQTVKFLAFLAVGVLLLWFAFHNVDFSKLGEDLKEANYYWLLLSVFFASLAFVSRARRWVLLINPLGFKPSFWNSFHAMMTGYLANIALPRIGEITRCVALGKKEKIPVDQLIGTVVIERTIDFISLLIIMVILIFTSGGIIGSFLKESILIPVQEKIYSLFGNTMDPLADPAPHGCHPCFPGIQVQKEPAQIQVLLKDVRPVQRNYKRTEIHNQPQEEMGIYFSYCFHLDMLYFHDLGSSFFA